LLLPPDEKTKFLHHGFEGRLGNQLFECASAAGLGALHGMQTCFPYLPYGITYEGSVLTSDVKVRRGGDQHHRTKTVSTSQAG